MLDAAGDGQDVRPSSSLPLFRPWTCSRAVLLAEPATGRVVVRSCTAIEPTALARKRNDAAPAYGNELESFTLDAIYALQLPGDTLWTLDVRFRGVCGNRKRLIVQPVASAPVRESAESGTLWRHWLAYLQTAPALARSAADARGSGITPEPLRRPADAAACSTCIRAGRPALDTGARQDEPLDGTASRSRASPRSPGLPSVSPVRQLQPPPRDPSPPFTGLHAKTPVYSPVRLSRGDMMVQQARMGTGVASSPSRPPASTPTPRSPPSPATPAGAVSTPKSISRTPLARITSAAFYMPESNTNGALRPHQTDPWSALVKHPRPEPTSPDTRDTKVARFSAQTAAASRLPRGLVNAGNSCYMNAVLQCLIGCPTFVADLLREPLRHLLTPAADLYASLTFLAEARRRAGHAEEHAGIGSIAAGRAIDPQCIRQSMALLSARFDGEQQQDAHEFLLLLLDRLETQLASVIGEPADAVRCDDDAPAPVMEDPVHANFASVIRLTLTCDRCGHPQSTTEFCRNFSLDLIADTTNAPRPLTTLFQRFFAVRLRNGASDAPSVAGHAVTPLT